jgi:hypothetical protein
LTDSDYWKRRYEHSWKKAASKEEAIINLIKTETGLDAVPIGLGATSDEFLSGSASSYGFERGGADLEIVGTNIHLEVTGPLSKSVKPEAPLWIRPDKVSSADRARPAIETWVIHHLAYNNLLRVVPLDGVFFGHYKAGHFKIAHPFIRGTRETYLELSAQHVCVRPWAALIERLQEIQVDGQ